MKETSNCWTTDGDADYGSFKVPLPIRRMGSICNRLDSVIQNLRTIEAILPDKDDFKEDRSEFICMVTQLTTKVEKYQELYDKMIEEHMKEMIS